MFTNAGVPTCPAVLTSCSALCVERVQTVSFLANLAVSTVRFTSRLWEHWRFILYCTCNIFFVVG